MYLVNYTNKPYTLENMGETIYVRPGPNWLEESEVLLVPKPLLESGTVAIVQDLSEVQWERVPEPWRSGWRKQYGNLWEGDARREEYRKRLQAHGESIRLMNKEVRAEDSAPRGPRGRPRKGNHATDGNTSA